LITGDHIFGGPYVGRQKRLGRLVNGLHDEFSHLYQAFVDLGKFLLVGRSHPKTSSPTLD